MSDFIKSRSILKSTVCFVALFMVSGIIFVSPILAKDTKPPEVQVKPTAPDLNNSSNISNSTTPQEQERPPQEKEIANAAQAKQTANSESLKNTLEQPESQNRKKQTEKKIEQPTLDFLYAVLLAIGIILIAFMLTPTFKNKKEPSELELIDKQNKAPSEPLTYEWLIPFKNKKSQKSELFDKQQGKAPLKSLTSEWLIVDCSVIGKDHINRNMPCQDSRHIERIDQQWGVAVCCDGAGSAANSDQGSRFVAEQTAKILAFAVKKHQWHTDNELPNKNDWKKVSEQVLSTVYSKLETYAKEQSLDMKSLACTVIAVIYSPIGLLVTHIGDGRAAYCNEAGEWHAIIKPFKGEEANQTVFITSSIWHDTNEYIESDVIIEQPYGFTLLTDGCEDFAFLTNINTAKNPDEIKVEDVNQPFDGFYKPLVQHFKDMYGKYTNEAIQSEWASILEKGTDKIKDEPDDKTMILGMWV